MFNIMMCSNFEHNEKSVNSNDIGGYEFFKKISVQILNTHFQINLKYDQRLFVELFYISYISIDFSL